MELILLILKIILLALLAVLGIIILLAGMILFIPIHYEASGSIEDEWKLNVKGKLSYCLFLFKLIFSYQNGQTDMQMYLFGFRKKPGSDDKNAVSGTNATEVDATEGDATEVEEKESSEETAEADITIHEKKAGSSEPEQKLVQKETQIKKEKIKKEKIKEEKNKKEKIKEKQSREKKQSKFDFHFWKQQLTDEHNKYVVRKLWSEAGYLLKHFKFRKIKTDLFFSTGDPAATGQILGILCMIPMLYRYDFKITPDFEADDAYLKGTFFVAGKVRLVHLFMTLLRLIFDKEVRLVVKRILTQLDK